MLLDLVTQQGLLRHHGPLALRRMALGLSQDAMASRCGLDRSQVSRLETGAMKLKAGDPRVDRLALGYDVEPETMHAWLGLVETGLVEVAGG